VGEKGFPQRLKAGQICNALMDGLKAVPWNFYILGAKRMDFNKSNFIGCSVLALYQGTTLVGP
jgi:hypothetical protein